MAQFLALLKRDSDNFTPADFTPLLEAEAQHVRTLYTEGTIRQVFGRKDAMGAVLVIEAADLDAADAAVRSLPLAQKGMLTIDIFELSPYRGFAPQT